METTSPSNRPGPQRYRVLAVEPDERFRTRMTLELAGIVPAPLLAVEEATREIIPGEPTVVVFGPSLATPDGFGAVQRIARTFPEVGVVLLVEELTTSLLQEALRSGVRDAVTVDAGERQIRQSVERVGETMSGVVNRAAAAATEPRAWARCSSPSPPRVASARALSRRTLRCSSRPVTRAGWR